MAKDKPISRDRLIADIEHALNVRPHESASELPPLGMIIVTKEAAIECLRFGQLIGISPRYLREILRELKG